MKLVIELPGQEDADEAIDALNAVIHRAGYDGHVIGVVDARFDGLLPYITGRHQ